MGLFEALGFTWLFRFRVYLDPQCMYTIARNPEKGHYFKYFEGLGRAWVVFVFSGFRASRNLWGTGQEGAARAFELAIGTFWGG